jgi:SAM-dependent methyltransferase
MIEATLETIVCPNCNSDSWVIVAKPVSHNPKIEGQFSVVRCQSCGMHYLNPRPDGESLGNFYKIIQEKSSSYTTDSPSLVQKSFLKQLWYNLNYSNPLLSMIDCEPVLDIGCGSGELLSELSGRGYEAHGLEFDPVAVADCVSKGFKVTQGNVQNFEIPKGVYKCIVLSHTLEHLSDPVAVLQKLRDALPPDGKIVIAVPYVKSPMVKLFGDSWHGWDPPFHLFHFDKSTMRQICEKAGLVVTRVKVGGHPEDFTRSLAIRSGKHEQHLILRAALWPFFWVAGALGQGSYMLVSAKVK